MSNKILLFVLMIASATFSLVAENPFFYDGLYYYIMPDTDHKVKVSGYGNISGALTIPSHVRNNNVTYEVIRIDASSFKNCTSLTSVSIPSTVTIIYGAAFSNCTNLTSISIPNSVTTVPQFVQVVLAELVKIVLEIIHENKKIIFSVKC